MSALVFVRGDYSEDEINRAIEAVLAKNNTIPRNRTAARSAVCLKLYGCPVKHLRSAPLDKRYPQGELIDTLISVKRAESAEKENAIIAAAEADAAAEAGADEAAAGSAAMSVSPRHDTQGEEDDLDERAEDAVESDAKVPPLRESRRQRDRQAPALENRDDALLARETLYEDGSRTAMRKATRATNGATTAAELASHRLTDDASMVQFKAALVERGMLGAAYAHINQFLLLWNRELPSNWPVWHSNMRAAAPTITSMTAMFADPLFADLRLFLRRPELADLASAADRSGSGSYSGYHVSFEGSLNYKLYELTIAEAPEELSPEARFVLNRISCYFASGNALGKLGTGGKLSGWQGHDELHPVYVDHRVVVDGYEFCSCDVVF